MLIAETKRLILRHFHAADAQTRVPRLIAMIDPQNVASIRVAEKAGFRYEREVMFEGYTHPDWVYAICPPTD